jgi:hypothetical protein
MREYGRVHSAFWASADVQALSDDAKMLALYLLSCSHGTIAGAFRMPDGYVSEDLKWTSTRVSKGFEELFKNGFVNRCETTKWVWIRKFLQWNAPENPNQWKAVWKIVGQIPLQCVWRADFLALLAKLAGREPPPEANPCETVPEPFRNLNSIPTATATASQQEEDKPVALKRDDGPVDRIFEHWRSEFRHPKAGLDPKRRRAIQRSLEAYDEDTLKAAISGYKLSPHHMGQNDQRTVYDDISLFLRDAEHIDRGLNFARAPPTAVKSAVEIARENLRKNINGSESRVVSEQTGRSGDSGVGSLARLLR